MNLTFITDRNEALAFSGALDLAAHRALSEFQDEPPASDLGRRLVERAFDAPEFALVVAREDEQTLGLCATAPYEDPLTGERIPMIVLLFVEQAHRHRGLARALAAEARRQLARRGFRRLAARAGHNDDALISMGERWGYVRQWEILLHEA